MEWKEIERAMEHMRRIYGIAPPAAAFVFLRTITSSSANGTIEVGRPMSASPRLVERERVTLGTDEEREAELLAWILIMESMLDSDLADIESFLLGVGGHEIGGSERSG